MHLRLIRLLIISSVVLFCAQIPTLGASAPKVQGAQTPDGNGTHMRSVLQKKFPLVLIETTHGIDDLLEHAVAENVSKSTIVSYKIGWVVWYHDSARQPEIGMGKEVQVKRGIAPRVVIGVPSQNVSGDWAVGARSVTFFVAEATTADGSVFKADVNQVTKDAAK